MNKKKALRIAMKKKLNSQNELERRQRSATIRKKLFKLHEFVSSRCIMLYVSQGRSEVETKPIIKKALDMGKKVVLPTALVKKKNIRPVRFRNFKDGLKKGPHGIYEPKKSRSERPISKKEIDLVIVPGLAFDRDNNRLGHGQGYYDNFLRMLPDGTPKIGLGFRFQLFDKIPTTSNDVSLARVITN